MNLSRLVAAAVAGVVAMSAEAPANPPAPQPRFSAEKCYGINVRGRNDCAAPGAHSCAGESKLANDPRSWIYVPLGTCAKIAGASTMPKG
jgi:uncharacterized membrane protein